MPARKVSLDSNKKQPVKKPRLSELMPDKTPKAVAARKQAVKRMYKEAPQKSQSKRAPAPLAKEAKKPQLSKQTKAKSAASPAPTASRPRSRSSKSTPRDRVIIATNIGNSDLVTLPNRVSVRAQEKVLAILSTLSKDFKHSAETVSYVAGFCFVFFGSYLALAFSGALPPLLTPQAAQVLSSTTGASVPTQTELAPSITNPKATFSLLDPLPPVVSGISKHVIEVTHADLSDVTAYSLATGEAFDIASEKVVDGTYRITIDASSLAPARYVLRVRVASVHDKTSYVFKVGEFQIQPPATDVVQNEATTTAATNRSATTSSPAQPVPVPLTNKEKVTDLRITTLATELRDRTVITVTGPDTMRTVELYVRPLKSSTKRFIGLAERSAEGWRYFFNTRNVPNGQYEIVARSKVDDRFLEASSNQITIANFTETEVPDVEPATDEEVLVEEIPVDPENSRSFSEVSLFSLPAQVETTDDAATTTVTESTSEIDFIIEQYRTRIEEVLRRYAVARQSEDALMLELVTNEIKAIQSDMVTDVLLDPTLNYLGDDIDVALSERFDDIKRRIDTFEELRRTATERASALDRDGDGISDFDETNLYQTDADKSDTDADGVPDGIEVMRGFDPRDASAEVVISYEMPQDTIGLVEDELLKIESVSPVIKTDDPTVAPIVQAEIRGKGLPNSFVTIYIFSSPHIVTVRTGEDGSFVYTFEKELEDGEHEVYVAVTDNTGAIMARSNPFRFVKQAEAFSPIAGSVAVSSDTTLTGIDVFGSHVAVGLGILALGFILLILGATLRDRTGVLVTSNQSNAVPT